ncbi:hypothetical protein [Alloactinosynnema sp. L-07]|uniref:hypothetical protein n=1 Tax=Alloactinosynnema sp. L-07 TaxID=1653480 RepID=UPI00065F05C0|nr:hypothetical protein [Alloactinosynnema sp. L-07]CRK59833.1 hypothetical protein [Alloactinosynnema sp. L-07]
MLPALLVAGALGANLAFLGLGIVFDYPDVLAYPPLEVMDRFADNQVAVSTLFLLLALSAGLLAPISFGLVARTPRPDWIVPLGVTAAAVQVIGLLRWPAIVPFIEDPETFRTVSTILGTVVGETFGYLATAAWTLVVARQFGLRVLAIPAAALILSGVLVPLGVPGADLANFVGYLLWSLWLIALAWRVWRASGDARVETAAAA